MPTGHPGHVTERANANRVLEPEFKSLTGLLCDLGQIYYPLWGDNRVRKYSKKGG